MTIGDAVKARLLDIAPLTALVDQRVFELVLPQNERRKSVRFQVIGTLHETHIRGPINQYAQRCQVDSYVPVAGTVDPIATARDIGAAVLGDGLGEQATGLAGWAGVVGASPETPIHIFDVDVLNDGDVTYEEDEQLRVRLRQEYRIHWRVLTAT